MQITQIFKQCTVDGMIIKLPAGQLERNDYLEVKKALELIGGSWKGGKTQGFVFKEDPSDYLSQLCEGEKINLKKEFQFFGTPPALADQLVKLAELQSEHTVLEPSAGQGAIVKAIHRVFPELVIDCYELMDLNRSFLEKLPNTCIIGSDFITEEKETVYAYFYGCDNDVTCCKMAVINLLQNTLQGEIALMDSLKMEYTKSWEVSYRYNSQIGGNLPVYRVIEDKNDSVLWKLHMNSFNRQESVIQENLITEIQEPTISIFETVAEPDTPPEPIPVPVQSKKSKSPYQQLQFQF